MAGKIKQQTLPRQYLHFGLGRHDFPALFSYFRFSISYMCVCVVVIFFLKIYLQQLSMLLSTRQELRLNSFIACPGLSVVSLLLSLSLSLSIWYHSLSFCVTVCLPPCVCLTLATPTSRFVNCKFQASTFVLTLFYLWHPLSFPSLSLSLSHSCSLHIC